MSDFVDQFVYDYVTDRRALQKAFLAPSPTLHHYKHRSQWNQNSKIDLNNDFDILRGVLRRHLARKGFETDYEDAASRFDRERAQTMQSMVKIVEAELMQKEIFALKETIAEEMRGLEQNELRLRRNFLKRFLQERRELKTIMFVEQVELIQILEFSARKQILRDGLLNLDRLRHSELTERSSLSNIKLLESSQPAQLEDSSKNDVAESTVLEAPINDATVSSVSEQFDEEDPKKALEQMNSEYEFDSQNSLEVDYRLDDTDREALVLRVKSSKCFFVGMSLTEFGNSSAVGLIVDALYVGGPATKAGIQLGDIIVAVGGLRVPTFDKFKEALVEYATIGDPLSFVIIRPCESLVSGNSDTHYYVSEVHVPIATSDTEFRLLGDKYYFDTASHSRIYRSS